MLTLRLPQEIENRLEKLAKKTGRTKSYYAREAIIQHLDEIEDIYLSEKRLEDLKSGRSQTCSLGSVKKELGLADWCCTSNRIKQHRQE